MILNARLPVLAILVGLNSVSLSPDHAVHAVAIQSRQLGNGRTAEVAVAPGDGAPASGGGQSSQKGVNGQQQAVQPGSVQNQNNDQDQQGYWSHNCDQHQHQVRAIDIVPSNPFVGIANTLFSQFVFQWPKGDGSDSGNPSNDGSTNTTSSSLSAKTSNLNSPEWQNPTRRADREPSSNSSKKNGNIVISDKRGTSYIVPRDKTRTSKRDLGHTFGLHHARSYPGKGRGHSRKPRQSFKRQIMSQQVFNRRTLDGTPGKMAITSDSSDSPNQKIIAWLAMSPNDDKSGDPNAPYVLNASDKEDTKFYMQNVPPTWSPGQPIAQGPDQPIPVRLAIDGTPYCATFDPNPQSAQPLTAQTCYTGPDEGMPHHSQVFMYDGETGEVKPAWASQDQNSGDSSTSSVADPSSASSSAAPSASGGSLSARQDVPPSPSDATSASPPPPTGSADPSNPSAPPADPSAASAQGDAPAGGPSPGSPSSPAPPGGAPAPPAAPAGLPISPPAPASAMSNDGGSSNDPASPEPTQTVKLVFVRDDGKGPGAQLANSPGSDQSKAMDADPSSDASSSSASLPTASGQAFAAEETATVTRTITVTASPAPTGVNAQGQSDAPYPSADPSGSGVGAQGAPTSSVDPLSSSVGAQGVPTSSVDPMASSMGAQGVPTSSVDPMASSMGAQDAPSGPTSAPVDPSSSGIGAQGAPTPSSADPSGSGVGAQGVPTSSYMDGPSGSGIGAQGAPTSSPVDASGSTIGAQGVPTSSPADPSTSSVGAQGAPDSSASDATFTSPIQSPSSIGAQSFPPYTTSSIIASSMADAAFTSSADVQTQSPSASSAGLNAMSDGPQGTGANPSVTGSLATTSSTAGPNVEMFSASSSSAAQYGARTAAPSSSSDASAIAASIAASMRPTASGGSAEAAAAENTYVAAVMRRRRSPRSRRAARSIVTGQAKGMKAGTSHWESDDSVTAPYRWKFV